VKDEYGPGDRRGKEILLGIRPEHIRLKNREHVSSMVRQFTGRVQGTGVSLSRALVYLTVGNQTIVGALDPFLRPEEGKLLPLCFSLDKAVIFDSVSGAAILPSSYQ